MEYNLNEQLNKMKKLMGVMPINESLLDEKMSNDDIYTKYYSKIPKEDFEAIVNADPSKKKDGSIGKFTKWMLSLYQKESLQLEDLYKATEYLTLYMKHFNHVEKKDINMFKSLGDLYKEIEKFKENADDYKSNSERDNEIKKDAEKVYEDSEWLVVVPKTKEASCYYGKGTQWCTAASDDDYENNMFDSYNADGNLYININKHNGRKYQFHFADNMFMDETDAPIATPIYSTMAMSMGLIDFYCKRYGGIYKRYFSAENLKGVRKYNVKGLDFFLIEEVPYDKEGKNISNIIRIPTKTKYGMICYENVIYRLKGKNAVEVMDLPDMFIDKEIKSIELVEKTNVYKVFPEQQNEPFYLINNIPFDVGTNKLGNLYFLNRNWWLNDGDIYKLDNYAGGGERAVNMGEFPYKYTDSTELLNKSIQFYRDASDRYYVNIDGEGYNNNGYTGVFYLNQYFYVKDHILTNIGFNKEYFRFPIDYTNPVELANVTFKEDYSGNTLTFIINGIRYNKEGEFA